MTVSDYIFHFLTDKGIRDVFMITGGQAMFLDDAVYRNKQLKPICFHHEQAAGMSADAYGRITGIPGVALITAGPAAINVLNGVVGGWTDSSPMIVISGQSALSSVQYQEETKIRQYGIQGINIRHIVEPVTKFFITVDDPSLIQYYMQKAYYLALHGRPGPVWIDVPLDMQKMEVPNKSLKEYVPTEREEEDISKIVKQVYAKIKLAQKPLLLVGQGIRLAHAADEFDRIIKKLNMPILTSRLGIDIISSDHPLYVGRPGNYGERSANFALQQADFILVLGSRLSSSTVGYNPKNLGKNAYKIVVDIDQEELDKPGVIIDMKVHSDVRLFLQELNRQSSSSPMHWSSWTRRCQHWKKTYPVVLPSYAKERKINSYYFTDALSNIATSNDSILVDTGSCFHVACQAWKIKKNQHFLTTGGISSMGYWCAGIGVCIAHDKKNTIVITGDGSFQFNIQELATIVHNKLPLKIFIFNNNGYLLIRQTQTNFMEGRLIGEGPKTGVWCPDSMKIAKAYGIKGVRISSKKTMRKQIQEVLRYKGPVICDIIMPEWQQLIPRTASVKKSDGTLVAQPFDDMFPFLDREVFAKETNG